LVVAFCVIGMNASSQAQWQCLYATYDDFTDFVNCVGDNVMSVGVIRENMFVALVYDGGATSIPDVGYLVPYVNADSALGRVNFAGYSGDNDGVFQIWSDEGFDQVAMLNARQLTCTPDSLIYVANNDQEHNILVFKFTGDTTKAVPNASGAYPRQITGNTTIYGIEVDANGYVYVCNDTSTGVSDDLKIYAPVDAWTAFHTDAPVRTVDLPDGIYKGITTNGDGSELYVCDYTNRTILKFKGSPTTGYTQDAGFQFAMAAEDTIPGSTRLPRPLGLKLLQPNNILLAACTDLFAGSAAYDYSRIYLVNPNTGALAAPDPAINRIDAAQWNFDHIGAYNDRTDGKVPGNASGYASTYDVEVDENGDVYTHSYYGWTVDKWAFTGELPIITDVEQIGRTVPEAFTLAQNYPNPFNPATTIEFSLPASGLVSLRVYDMLGREVAVLVNEVRPAGTHRVTFDARTLTSGTYLYALRSGAAREIKTMVLVK
jgi:hypothetical protein